ncbi:MAG: hypothetical protein M1814_005596 [Vezdaea aestivalis]|nr:MAG: hypothetical protein M1814_005596 [Vezdaea aestivalis]
MDLSIEEPSDRGEESTESESDQSWTSESDNEANAAYKSRYRAFTKAIRKERLIAKAVDRERGQDLALHLYAAHYSSKKFTKIYADSKPNKYRNKRTWIDKKSPEFKDARLPPKNWTLWPQAPDLAPQEWESWNVESQPPENFKPPSFWLEEMLLGFLQKTTRELFNARERDSGLDVPALLSSKPRPIAAQSGKERQLATSLFRDKKQPYLVPQNLTDEDLSRVYLLPLVRTTLTDLCKVLAALHSARGTQRRRSKDHRVEKVQKTLRPPIAIRQAARNILNEPVSYAPMHARDWSEVLGAAAHTGISPSVIERAKDRCEALFGEKMTFRTILPSGKDVGGILETTDDPIKDSLIMMGGIHRDGYQMRPMENVWALQSRDELDELRHLRVLKRVRLANES